MYKKYVLLLPTVKIRALKPQQVTFIYGFELGANNF